MTRYLTLGVVVAGLCFPGAAFGQEAFEEGGTGGMPVYQINVLEMGQELRTNQGLRSQNGAYNLILQADGNLCLYEGGDSFIWCAMTNDQGSSNLQMQADGNLVLYDRDGNHIWSTDTYRGGPDLTGARLVLENDGSLVLYNVNGGAIWESRQGRLY